MRIDDDLLRELRERAKQQKVSLGQAVNEALRKGLASRPVRRRQYREQLASLGSPTVNLDKALSLAAAHEDVEVIRKLELRK